MKSLLNILSGIYLLGLVAGAITMLTILIVQILK
jgi:hypothetical protein